jgi:hypothetical protein
MFDDPVVLETRKHREAYAASFDYDLGRIIADMQSRQGRDGRVVVDRMSEEKSEPSDEHGPSAQPTLNSKGTPRSP